MARNSGSRTRPQTIVSVTSSEMVISPAFKLVVILVFVVIILTGSATVLLSIFADSKQVALDSMSSAFTASLGAILGLIGGKAV